MTDWVCFALQNEVEAVVEEAEFKVFDELVDFEQATRRCIEENATLARVSDANTQVAVFGLVASDVSNVPDNFWVGKLVKNF